ncbi:hypothetical protein PSPO01_04412 [Paraphaeosphaeria sporulosa]
MHATPNAFFGDLPPTSHLKPIWDAALRATQIISAFVVLGLSTHLVATVLQGLKPFTLVWANMVGVATLIMSILGDVSNWCERLEGKPMLLFDGCTAAANHASEVLLAIGLTAAECTVLGITELGKNIPSLLFPKVDFPDDQNCENLYEPMRILSRRDKSHMRWLIAAPQCKSDVLGGSAFLRYLPLRWIRYA